jgi:acetyl-CoA carboxylase biotin carboxyl carrier protein
MKVEMHSMIVGTVLEIATEAGAEVAEGDEILVIESMKMEIPIEAEVSGTVAGLAVAEGDKVDEGTLLLTIET